jgi:pimeloyl-ACP methyl ester carboxylesterase
MRRPLLALACCTSLLACAAPRARAPGPDGMTWVEGGAGRLRVSDGGSGEPAVVFVHGLGSDLEVWRAQLDHVRAFRRAVAYDQRGHGASERARDGKYTIEALVGHSMSGEVLTTYAGAHPDLVAGLLYLDAEGDTHAYPAEEVRKYLDHVHAPSLDAAGRRALFEKNLGPARPATRERVLASLDRIDPPAFGQLFEAMLEFRDGRERLAPYHGPAAALEVAGNEEQDMAAIVLGLPRATLSGVSHWLQLDDPAGVNGALDAFLAEVARKP